ncbi:MAG: chloramphenicol phosphotransferase CPT family protein [Firmicutes bacterium]|nr:chloramphenicol phosphotransferase CPT family protein [Bacillota bacterium]
MQRREPTAGKIAVKMNQSMFLKPYLFHRIVSLIHDYSYNIIVNAVFDGRAVLEDWQTIFADNNHVIFVAVHCPLEELENRERARGDRLVGLAKKQLENFHTDIMYDIEVNTFENTVDECVQKIIDHINNM